MFVLGAILFIAGIVVAIKTRSDKKIRNKGLWMIAIGLVIVSFSTTGNSLDKSSQSEGLDTKTDMELVLQDDINLFDEFKDDELKEIQKKYKKDKRTSIRDYEDSSIFHISVIRSSSSELSKVDSLEISIDKSEDDDFKNMSLDKAMEVMKAKSPNKVLEKYYKEAIGTKIYPKEDSSKDTTYVLSYTLKDEAKKLDSHSYTGSITTYITQAPNGNIKNIRITTFKPRWMSSLDINGYESMEWNYK